MSNRKRPTNRISYAAVPPPPPTDPDIPPEVDALLVCVYEFLGSPLPLNFIGWLRSHGFKFIASPPAVNNEKNVTARSRSGDTITVSVSLDREVIAAACQAIRVRRAIVARAAKDAATAEMVGRMVHAAQKLTEPTPVTAQALDDGQRLRDYRDAERAGIHPPVSVTHQDMHVQLKGATLARRTFTDPGAPPATERQADEP